MMKRTLFAISGLLISSLIFAQAPQAFQYQAVVRDNAGNLLVEQGVDFQIDIIQGAVDGSPVYSETHSATTNDFGLVTLDIGMGTTTGDFSAVEWGASATYLKLWVNGSEMGTSQLLSVPYALHAQSADYAKVDTANTFRVLSEKGNTPCNASTKGAMRYNEISNTVEYCNGSNWITMASGLSIGLPLLTTSTITNIHSGGAYSGGTIGDNGGAEIFEKGVCWNETGIPTINDETDVDGPGSNVFYSNIIGLNSNDVYYVRAFATNTAGTGYGDELGFTTLPAVITTYASGNTISAFSTGGEVMVGGDEEITARGVVYGTVQDPTLSDNVTNDGTGAGSFASSISSLVPNTIYYFRSYATNSGGTGFGAGQSTATQAEIATAEPTEVNVFSVTAGGNISEGGGAEIDLRGICIGTASAPTWPEDNFTQDGRGSGEFTSVYNGVMPNSKYYYRAYCLNPGGTSYGNERSFVSLAAVNTGNAGYSNNTSFSTNNSVDEMGEEAISERGVVYGTNSSPTKNDNYITAGTGNGGFSVNVTGLQPLETYYYRAYAINEGGISYGTEYSTWIYLEGGGVSDIDGNTYKTVIVGGQEWMAENLKTTRYNDGSDIPLLTGEEDWHNATEGGYCWNDQSGSPDYEYGGLYNHFAVSTGNLCPSGWHVPAMDEWDELMDNADGAENLASGDWTDFYMEENEGKNKTGFSAIHGPFRTADGHIEYSYYDESAYWWLSDSEGYDGYYAALYANHGFDFWMEANDPRHGHSIRCLKD